MLSLFSICPQKGCTYTHKKLPNILWEICCPGLKANRYLTELARARKTNTSILRIKAAQGSIQVYSIFYWTLRVVKLVSMEDIYPKSCFFWHNIQDSKLIKETLHLKSKSKNPKNNKKSPIGKSQLINRPFGRKLSCNFWRRSDELTHVAKFPSSV